MPNNKEIEYIRCHNCGKYIIADDAYKKKYCSLACSSLYARCQSCGSFYLKKKGYSDVFCTADCELDPENPKKT